MASVDQPFSTQDQDNQNQQNNGNGNQPPQIASGTGNIGGGGGSTQSGNNGNGSAPTPTTSSSANQAGTSSGTYPNLQKYMNANANWNQASGGLGGEIAGNLNQQGSQVENSINQANTGFQNQGNAWQAATGAANTGFQQGLSGGAANYMQNNPNAQQQANTALNAQYTGPANLNAVNPNLQQQTNSYANTAQQGTTEAGRFNLLNQMFGGNNYTQGQQNLDQALLQGNKGQMQQLQGAAQQGTQAQQNLTNAAATDQNLGNQWANFANQTQQGARGALNSTIGSQNQTIQNEFQNAQTAQTAQIAQIGNELATGQISQQDLNMLQGLQVGQNLYNVNAGQFVGGQQLNAQNTGTAQDYANMQALAKLGGTNGAITSPNSQILGQFSATPGTLYNSTNDLTYNNTGLQSAVANAAQQYNAAVNLPANGNNQSLVQRVNADLLAGTEYNNASTGQQYYGGQTFNSPTGAQILSNAATLSGSDLAQLGINPSQLSTVLPTTNRNDVGGGIQSDTNAIDTNSLNAYLSANGGGNASPLSYFTNLIQNNSPQFMQNYTNQLTGVGESTGGQNWNQALGIEALQGIMQQNAIYDPTRTLQLAPSTTQTPQLAAMMPNAGSS